MFGEFAKFFPVKKYGHPKNWYTRELAMVPWLIIDGASHNIVSEPPNQTNAADINGDIKDRLEDLGYV
jgi:hypothetical protein